jgi:DNA primase
VKVDKSLIDVEDMLSKLGITGIELKADEVNFDCPFGGHMDGGSASMNVDSTAWYCFGCHAKGDAIRFVSMLEGVAPWKAKRWLYERYCKGFREPEGSFAKELMESIGRKPVVQERSSQELPDTHLEQFWVDWNAVEAVGDQAPPEFRYMLERGFSPDVLFDWEFGFDRKSNRIAMAIRDHNNALCGFKGRTIDPDYKPKYIVLGGVRYDFDTYDIGDVVFGLGRAKSGRLVVCEGEFNAIALDSAGVQSAVALAHSHATPRQLQLIRDRAESVVVYFDDDQAGWDGAKQLVTELHPYMPVSIAKHQAGDPAEIAPNLRVEAVNNASSPFALGLI